MPDVAGYHLCWCSFKAEKKCWPGVINHCSGSVRNGEMSGHEMVAYGQ